jgi:hypothetical protein
VAGQRNGTAALNDSIDHLRGGVRPHVVWTVPSPLCLLA